MGLTSEDRRWTKDTLRIAETVGVPTETIKVIGTVGIKATSEWNLPPLPPEEEAE